MCRKHRNLSYNWFNKMLPALKYTWQQRSRVKATQKCWLWRRWWRDGKVRHMFTVQISPSIWIAFFSSRRCLPVSIEKAERHSWPYSSDRKRSARDAGETGCRSRLLVWGLVFRLETSFSLKRRQRKITRHAFCLFKDSSVFVSALSMLLSFSQN